jgi:hypothetical protein
MFLFIKKPKKKVKNVYFLQKRVYKKATKKD